MQYKNAKTARFCMILSLLVGGLALVVIGIFIASLRGSASALDQDINVNVNNAAVAEVSVTGDPYTFGLTVNEKGEAVKTGLVVGEKAKISRTVSVKTNSTLGFTLYVRGGNESSLGNNTLTNDTYSTADANIFKSVESETAYDSLSGSVWGYAVAASADATSFKAIPTADKMIGTSTDKTGTYDVTVAVSVGWVTAAEYSGSLIFTATTAATPTGFGIIYDTNYAGAFTTDSYSGADESHAFTITSSVPTREGYTFQGWSMSSSATSASYTSGNSLTLYSDPTSGQYGPVVTLYAVWIQNTGTESGTKTATINTINSNSGEVIDTETSTSTYSKPKGVSETTDSTLENVNSNNNLPLAIAALATATLATGGCIYFLVGKRDKDDGEEEGVAK